MNSEEWKYVKPGDVLIFYDDVLLVLDVWQEKDHCLPDIRWMTSTGHVGTANVQGLMMDEIVTHDECFMLQSVVNS
jgi:hypothetical protein